MQKKTSFCNLVEGYKTISDQKDIAKVVTGSKGYDFAMPKLYENKAKAQKSNRRGTEQV